MFADGLANNPFSYFTDIISTKPFPLGDDVPRSVREMLGGSEGSVLDTYGGEFEWDKFDVRLWKSRGETADFSIRYGVNMTAYNDEMDSLETYSAIIPYWSGQNEQNQPVVVWGDMVTNNEVTVSGRTECVPMDFSQDFENQPTKQQLEDIALEYLEGHEPAIPARTIKVEFVQTQDSGSFSEFKRLQKCRLCDSVRVVFPRYGMNGYFKIVKTVFDVLQERYTEMELGTLSTTLSEALGIGSGTSGGGYSGGGGGGVVYRLTKRGDIITLTGGGESSSVTDSDTKYGLSINGHTVALVAGGSDSSVTVPDNFTTEYETKLNGIEAGAEVNVQSDWNASSGDAQILNKPSIPAKTSELANDSNFINGNAGGLFYGTCSTAAGTQAKAVACAEFASADLVAGTFIVVTFTNTNTGATGGLTLNVNGTGAKPLKYINNGALGNIPSTGYLKANVEYPFYYDGANWVVVMNYNTTYSAMSWSEMETGTATTGRTITATRLKEAVEYHAPVKSVNGQTGAVTIAVPDAVSVDQKLSSGTNIADITIGGTTTKLYAPTGGGGGITVLDCYPVGSYYETSDTSFDPNSAWGGTWVLDSKGRVTVSRDETVADFDTIGETGGEKTHALTVNEMPSHNHKVPSGWQASSTADRITYGAVNGSYQDSGYGGVAFIEKTGGGQAHNNMPPYVVVNRWHRTA
jgi:phage minor structural protein